MEARPNSQLVSQSANARLVK